MQNLKHFLDLNCLKKAELFEILNTASLIKKDRSLAQEKLKGKSGLLLLEKPSTRTAISFEVGVTQMGGHLINMKTSDSQMSRDETPHDTAKVLSLFVDFIIFRCQNHNTLEEMAKHASVPVINALSDRSHPCQILADLMTIQEKKGRLNNLKVSWFGEWNNVTTSFFHAFQLCGFEFHVSTPFDIPKWVQKYEKFHVTKDITSAAQDADVIVTDTWFSMGDKETENKAALLAPYQVNTGLLSKAKKDALFLHCLPAHRGQEVTDDVIDSAQSAVWDEAENRLHAQKALLLYCLENAL